jgi:uncharacterized membrane protein
LSIKVTIGTLKGIVLTALFLIYPYLVYRGIASGMSWLSPVIISGMFMQRAWVSKSHQAQLGLVLLAVTLLLGAYYLQTITAKVLPVLVQLMLMAFFGRTLLKGNEPPIIERIVLLQFPDSPPVINNYCRQLTQIWTAFFAGNALICTLLALWGSDIWWALYNGVIIYGLIGILAIGEYVYRRIYFADLSILHQGIPDPQAAIKAMIINGRKVFLDIKGH